MDSYEKYLELSTIVGKSKKAIFEGIKERIWKKAQGWKENLLSRPGKETLVNGVIQAIPPYAKSIFCLPSILIEDIHSLVANFLVGKLWK